MARRDADRLARDAKSAGGTAETRARAPPPNSMTTLRFASRRQLVEGPQPYVVGDAVCTAGCRRLPSRSSFATDVRSCADDKVAKVLADPGVRSPRLVPGRIALARRSALHAEASAHESLRTADFPQQVWRSKRARWLLSVICGDDEFSSYDGDSPVISAARP